MRLIDRKITINLNKFVIILFILSLFHPLFGLIFYIGSLKLVQKEKMIGAIKYMLIVTMRGILSIKTGVSLGNLDTIKLVFIIVLSLYILKYTFYNIKLQSFKSIFFCVIFFCVYVSIVSFISGSYPIVSTFKVWSFGLNFVAMLYGVYYTRERIHWINYMFHVLTPFFVISFLVIPFESFRIINNNFQGVFNHVNMMGIMGAIYISVLLNIEENKRIMYNILIAITLYMQYLTASRTGLFVSIFIISIHYFINLNIKKMVFFLITMTLLAAVYYINPTIKNLIGNEIRSYIYKGNENDILASRREVGEKSQKKFESNELIGSGFMVPFDKNIKDYNLNMSIIYEPGNLFWELLGGVGIIGLFLFFLFILVIILNGYINYISLILTAIGICLGEMVIFSINNMAILLYMLIGIYLIKEKKVSS
ncbi:O-antigen ligase family protein [Thomasclavelia cocleata]|uniref:O-antigen ligase family protein n=1 Tax=Thomasclavelia cocleata TaxID=69824 RepID=UPI002582D2C2|nr:O-antigen ligase family protein [Thomasclavelia cocleata]